LFYAAYRYKDVVELLLSKGADVNAKSASGKTPLFNAMQKDTAELLLGSGAEVNARDGSGCTPLFEAASEGCLDIVELFLSKGADVNVRSNSGETPLFRASRSKGIAELLLSRGAEINVKNEDRWTPLHEAAHYGHKAVVELLLGKGGEVNAQDKNGRTPLGAAMAEGCKDIVELLQSHGAEVTAEDKEEPLTIGTAGLQLDAGLACEAAGQMDKAEAVYLRVLRWYEADGSPAILPIGQDACFRLAEFYQKKGDLAHAADYCQRLIERRLAWEEAWKEDHWDRTDLAVDSMLYLYLGQICRLDGQYEGAVAADLKSIELDPKESVAYKELGIASFFDGQEAAAADAFKHAAALKNDDVNTLGWLAQVELQMGRMADALEVARRGMEADPTKPLAWTQAGTSLVQLARYDEAIKLLLDANGRFPENADIAWWLGKAYEGKGEGAELPERMSAERP
jgi:tetratricopeptide (TPR) repeat protein